MKFTSLALLGLLSLVAARDGLRASSSGSDDHDSLVIEQLRSIGESNCHGATSESSCTGTTDADSGEHCVWCECKAVPSVCVSAEESKSLPAGVFSCGTSENASEEKESSPSSSATNETDEDGALLYDFGVKTLQLRETIHEAGSDDADFCDASSKSISGYMDVKGSKVCRSDLFSLEIYFRGS